MNHQMVAHNFAHGKRGTGANVYTDGETIYSYGSHFMAGSRHVRKDGTVFFFITWETYSVSTAQHMRYINDAVHGMEVIEVADVRTCRMCYNMISEERFAKTGLATFKDQMKKEYNKALDEANDWFERAMKHRDGTQIQGQKLSMANMWRARANNIQKFAKLGKRMIPEYDISPEAKAKVDARERKRQEAERRELKKWLNGETDTYKRTSRPYLRLKMCKIRKAVATTARPEVRIPGDEIEVLMIETTWGVRNIPYDVVKTVIPYAEKCVKEGVSVTMYDEIDKINNVMQVYAKEQGVGLQWRLDSISHKGVIKFGCHHIPLKMAKRIQQQAKELRAKAEEARV